ARALEHRVQLTLRYPHALEAAKERAQARPRVNAAEPLEIIGGALEPPRHDLGHRSCCELAVLHPALPHESPPVSSGPFRVDEGDHPALGFQHPAHFRQREYRIADLPAEAVGVDDMELAVIERQPVAVMADEPAGQAAQDEIALSELKLIGRAVQSGDD